MALAETARVVFILYERKGRGSWAMSLNLITNTTTPKGLRVNAKEDTRQYEKGKKITDEEMNTIHLTESDFRGEWNYKIGP